MSTLATVYASDEDVALRASADFALLCPKDQKLAAGADGAFDPSAPWALTSASVGFLSQGLAPGQVVQLTKPVANFKPPGESFVIASVAANAVVLRRKGQPPGVGQPPGPPLGLTAVEFAVTTLGPQIEDASYDLNRRYGIDDLVAGRRSSDLYDPREVKQATVLTVLHRQYLDMSREAADGGDAFATKARAVKAELDELIARVVVHWTSANRLGALSPATTHFGTRLSR